jgi:hypothetical protein
MRASMPVIFSWQMRRHLRRMEG